MRSARDLRLLQWSAASAASTTVAVKPPRRKFGDDGCLLGGEHAARLGGKRRVIEAEHVADDDARIELGRLEVLLAKRARQLPPRGGDRVARGCVGCRVGEWQAGTCHDVPSAASNSAWCSVTKASMISPSASPSITCGSL